MSCATKPSLRPSSGIAQKTSPKSDPATSPIPSTSLGQEPHSGRGAGQGQTQAVSADAEVPDHGYRERHLPVEGSGRRMRNGPVKGTQGQRNLIAVAVACDEMADRENSSPGEYRQERHAMIS